MAGYTKRYNWFRDRQLLVLTSLILMAILPSILPEISAKLQAKRKVYKSTYRSSKLQIPITHVPVHPGKAYNWSKTSKQHCLGYSKIYRAVFIEMSYFGGETAILGHFWVKKRDFTAFSGQNM